MPSPWQEVKEAMAIDPAHAPAYNVLAWCTPSCARISQAEDSFRKGMELSPNYSEAHNNYGLFLCQRQPRTRKPWRCSTRLVQPSVRARRRSRWPMPAMCALEKGDLAQAEVYFIRALKRAPESSRPRCWAWPSCRFSQSDWLAQRGHFAASIGRDE
jgi:type IV pilus assembly protein PilF